MRLLFYQSIVIHFLAFPFLAGAAALAGAAFFDAFLPRFLAVSLFTAKDLCFLATITWNLSKSFKAALLLNLSILEKKVVFFHLASRSKALAALTMVPVLAPLKSGSLSLVQVSLANG